MQRAEDVHGVALGRRDNLLLDVLVDGAALEGLEEEICNLRLHLRFNCAHEARTYFVISVRRDCQVRGDDVPILAP